MQLQVFTNMLSRACITLMGRKRLQAPAFSGTSISLHRSLYFGVLIGKQPKVKPTTVLPFQGSAPTSRRKLIKGKVPKPSKIESRWVAIGRVPPKEVSTQVATNYPFRGVLTKWHPLRAHNAPSTVYLSSFGDLPVCLRRVMDAFSKDASRVGQFCVAAGQEEIMEHPP